MSWGDFVRTRLPCPSPAPFRVPTCAPTLQVAVEDTVTSVLPTARNRVVPDVDCTVCHRLDHPWSKQAILYMGAAVGQAAKVGKRTLGPGTACNQLVPSARVAATVTLQTMENTPDTSITPDALQVYAEVLGPGAAVAAAAAAAAGADTGAGAGAAGAGDAGTAAAAAAGGGGAAAVHRVPVEVAAAVSGTGTVALTFTAPAAPDAAEALALYKTNLKLYVRIRGVDIQSSPLTYRYRPPLAWDGAVGANRTLSEDGLVLTTTGAAGSCFRGRTTPLHAAAGVNMDVQLLLNLGAVQADGSHIRFCVAVSFCVRGGWAGPWCWRACV